MINIHIVIILLEVMTIERIMITDVISKGMLVFSIFIVLNSIYYIKHCLSQDTGSNVKKSVDDNYDADKKEFTKVSKYHSRDSLETPEDIDKDNV